MADPLSKEETPQDEPPMFSAEAATGTRSGGTPGAKPRRARRSSPLGLMSPSETEIPQANPLPSPRALAIMGGIVVAVLVLALALGGC